jgi:MFS transporter, BCD family, chlorophyll transporter
MASGNLINDQLPSTLLPKISILTMMRLGLFQMGLGMMSVLLFGLLNRILIKELGIPGTIASLILAVTLFVAPARIWFGQLSDTKPLFGLYRTWYVRIGSICFATIAFLAVQPIWKMGLLLKANNWLQATEWIALCTLLFGLYGVAISASSTPFATLLVDITDEEERSKIVAIDWAMLLVGTIAGGITIGVLLKKLGNCPSPELLQSSINQLFLIVPWLVVGFAFISTWGVEKKYSRFLHNKKKFTAAEATLQAQPQTKEIVGLKRAWQLLTSNQQTKFFFTFLIAMTLGLFLQDTILEPFGGDVFNLPAGETALLNVPYGIGTVLGILISGFLVAPRIGKKKTTQLGCQAVVLALVSIIFAGFTANPAILKLCLTLFGLASGITTTGAVTLMLDLTVAETAGTFIGAWGLAQALSRGVAAVLGGGLLDTGSFVFRSAPATAVAVTCATVRTTNPPIAYGLVLTVQAIIMLVAIGLLGRVNVKEFQAKGKENLQAVINNNLD